MLPGSEVVVKLQYNCHCKYSFHSSVQSASARSVTSTGTGKDVLSYGKEKLLLQKSLETHGLVGSAAGSDISVRIPEAAQFSGPLI